MRPTPEIMVNTNTIGPAQLKIWLVVPSRKKSGTNSIQAKLSRAGLSNSQKQEKERPPDSFSHTYLSFSQSVNSEESDFFWGEVTCFTAGECVKTECFYSLFPASGGGVPLAGKWSTFHISATHCRQLWPQVTPTLMPTTTLSPLPFYTFGQQASKGNTISKFKYEKTNIMTTMIFL